MKTHHVRTAGCSPHLPFDRGSSKAGRGAGSLQQDLGALPRPAGWQGSWASSYLIAERHVIGFLWFVLSWKWGQNLGNLAVTNQVLAVWG